MVTSDKERKRKMNKEHDHWFIEALQLIFISFKLAGIIDWSWLWVLAPVWISFVIGAVWVIIDNK